MKRIMVLACALVLYLQGISAADESDPVTRGRADTITDAVRVIVVKSGGEHSVRSVSDGSSGSRRGCAWSLTFAPELEDVPLGTSAGPKPHPDARFALLLCDGRIYKPIWVSPADIIDVDALARDEAQRYIEDVLVPAVRIGVNPEARGLVGLASWFWVEGFTGSVTAPPITVFGMTIDVRMTSGSVTWDFGDGSTSDGDLGRAYPAESSVQHTHQRDGTFTIGAAIELVPAYSIDGGSWLTLPSLEAAASIEHEVEQRQPVITKT